MNHNIINSIQWIPKTTIYACDILSEVKKPYQNIKKSHRIAIEQKIRQTKPLQCLCEYCGNICNDPTKDHIFPKREGYSCEVDNLAWVCLDCNRSKGSKSLIDWVDGLPDNSRYKKNLKNLLKNPFIKTEIKVLLMSLE